MPGEEGGNPSEEGFPPPDPHLPKTFDWWGGGAQGVRSGLVLKKFLCAVQKRDIPVTSIIPSSVCFGGSRGGSPLPARLAECRGSASAGVLGAEPLGLRGMGFSYRGR